MGVESLTGNITATVQGETPEDLIKELEGYIIFPFQNNIIRFLLSQMTKHLKIEIMCYNTGAFASRVFIKYNGNCCET